MSQTGHILVADDDPFFRGALVRMLEAAGYGIREVGDAGAALRVLGEEVFDLLIADVNMPGNEGLAVLSGQDIVPVLIVTGEPSVDSAIAALRGAAVDYLQKPVAPQEMLQRVEAGVKRGRTLRSLRSAEARLEGQLELVADVRRTLASIGLSSLPPPADSEVPPTVAEALSRREQEIARAFRRSPKVDDIAARLHISPHTVKNHLRHIYKKLGVRSRVELMRRLDDGWHGHG